MTRIGDQIPEGDNPTTDKARAVHHTDLGKKKTNNNTCIQCTNTPILCGSVIRYLRVTVQRPIRREPLITQT